MNLRLGYLNFLPYIMVTGDKFEGSVIMLVEALSRSANFSYRYAPKADRTWGSRYPNGTYDGHLGALQSGNVDVCLGPLVLSDDRARDFLLTTFYDTTVATIIASLGRASSGSFLGFLFTFERMIWILLLLTFVSLVWLSAIDDSLFDNDRKLTRSLKVYFWMYLASLFLEGSFKTPRKGLSKILLSIWLLNVLVLMNGFCCQFKALLMLKDEEEPIRSIEDLAKKPNVRLMIPAHTVYDRMFRDSDLKSFQQVYKNTMKQGGVSDYREQIKLPMYRNIKSGRNALLGSQETQQSYVAKYCSQLEGDRRMYWVNERISISYFSLALRKDFERKLYGVINRRIVWIREGGLVNKWKEIYSRGAERCQQAVQTDGEDVALGLTLLLPILLTFLGAQGACFFVFILEIYRKQGGVEYAPHHGVDT